MNDRVSRNSLRNSVQWETLWTLEPKFKAAVTSALSISSLPPPGAFIKWAGAGHLDLTLDILPHGACPTHSRSLCLEHLTDVTQLTC